VNEPLPPRTVTLEQHVIVEAKRAVKW
jgi:hypothetical protein